MLTPQQSALTLASFVVLFGGIRTIRIETHSRCKNAFDRLFQAVRERRALNRARIPVVAPRLGVSDNDRGPTANDTRSRCYTPESG
jgi:hypothetical protein